MGIPLPNLAQHAAAAPSSGMFAPSASSSTACVIVTAVRAASGTGVVEGAEAQGESEEEQIIGLSAVEHLLTKNLEGTDDSDVW
jgi:hypothetical protein